MADNFFTRASIGGIPNWVLLAGGGVLVLFVINRQKGGTSSQAQQAQQAAQQQALAAEMAAASAYPAAYGGGQQPIYILGGTGSPGANVSGSPGSNVPAAGLTPAMYQANPSQYFQSTAAGYNPLPQYATQTEQSLTGQQYYIPSYKAALQTAQAGQGYAQTAPGVFVQEPFSYFAGSGTDVYRPVQ